MIDNAKITNNCECSDYDEDFSGDYCDGICYDDMSHRVDEVLSQWKKIWNVSDTDRIAIHGSRIGWRNLSGIAQIRYAELSDYLKFDGDWSIYWTLDDDGKLHAKRTSHDEPMGAYFDFEIHREDACERCGEFVDSQYFADHYKQCEECFEKFGDE